MRHINKSESGRIHIPGTPLTDFMHPTVKLIDTFSVGDSQAARYLYPSAGRYFIVYEHADYEGRRWIVQEDQDFRANDLSASGLQDKISSIRVYGGA